MLRNRKLMTTVAAIVLVLPAVVLHSTDADARGSRGGGGHAARPAVARHAVSRPAFHPAAHAMARPTFNRFAAPQAAHQAAPTQMQPRQTMQLTNGVPHSVSAMMHPIAGAAQHGVASATAPAFGTGAQARPSILMVAHGGLGSNLPAFGLPGRAAALHGGGRLTPPVGTTDPSKGSSSSTGSGSANASNPGATPSAPTAPNPTGTSGTANPVRTSPGAGAQVSGNNDIIGNHNTIIVNRRGPGQHGQGQGQGQGSSQGTQGSGGGGQGASASGSSAGAPSGGGSSGSGGSANGTGSTQAASGSGSNAAAPAQTASAQPAAQPEAQAQNQQAAAQPAAAQPTPQANCLVRVNLQDQVLFKDLCTGQWAVGGAPVQQAQAIPQQ